MFGNGSIQTKHGINAVLLKGAAFFDNSVAPVSDRMMRDIDLLVHPEQIDTAARALVVAGYRDCEGLTEPGHFHRPPLMPETGVASVEIHRHLGYRPHFLPSAEVIASATEIVPGLLLPTLHHRIAHNVIHAQIENGDFVGGVVNLRDTLDLARLVVRCGLAFDWQSLADEARDRGFFYQLSGAISAAHGSCKAPYRFHCRASLGGSMLGVPLVIGDGPCLAKSRRRLASSHVRSRGIAMHILCNSTQSGHSERNYW